jgi:hypothetical protein
MNLFKSVIHVGIISTCLYVRAEAASVTDWHTFKASPATVLSGQGTDDPIMGSTATTSASAFLIGYLSSPLSLVNIGDKITLTFDISFNDAVGMAPTTGNGDQFRFGLFDINGMTKATADNTATAGVAGQTDGWEGYRLGVRSGSGTGSTGSIRERAAAGGDLNPMANAQTVLMGSPTGDQIIWSGAVNGVGGALYSGELTLELTALGVNLSGFFRGNNTTNLFAAPDTTAPYTSNFEAVGFLNGNSLNADQFLFQNVDVTYVPAVPEPSAMVLTLGGLFGLIYSGKRSKLTLTKT